MAKKRDLKQDRFINDVAYIEPQPIQYAIFPALGEFAQSIGPVRRVVERALAEAKLATYHDDLHALLETLEDAHEAARALLERPPGAPGS